MTKNNKALIESATKLILDNIITYKDKIREIDVEHFTQLANNVYQKAFCMGLHEYFLAQYNNIPVQSPTQTLEIFIKKMGLDGDYKEYTDLMFYVKKAEIKLTSPPIYYLNYKGLPKSEAREYHKIVYSNVFPYTKHDYVRSLSIILNDILEIKTYELDTKLLLATIIAFNRYAEEIHYRINSVEGVYYQSKDDDPIYNKSSYIKSSKEYKELEEMNRKQREALIKMTNMYNEVVENMQKLADDNKALSKQYAELNNAHSELLKKINNINYFIHNNPVSNSIMRCGGSNSVRSSNATCGEYPV